VAEQAARRHLEDVVFPPDDDAQLDAVAVAERLPRLARLVEIDDHVLALFFDAERGDLREARRLDEPHAAAQRPIAAPLLYDDGLAGADLDGGAREQVGDDLEVLQIADLDQGLTGGDNRRALLEPPQDDAVHRREERDRGRASAARLQEAGARHLELVLRRAHGEVGGLARAVERGGLLLGRLQFARGEHFLLDERPETLQLRLCERQLGADPFTLGARAADRRLRRAHARLELRPRARVEQRRVGRLELREDGLPRDHSVSGLELDPLHASGHRR
jgi:hypothetical protein